MNLNSFKRNRKALTALLICTGFIAAHPWQHLLKNMFLLCRWSNNRNNPFRV